VAQVLDSVAQALLPVTALNLDFDCQFLAVERRPGPPCGDFRAHFSPKAEFAKAQSYRTRSKLSGPQYWELYEGPQTVRLQAVSSSALPKN